MIFRSVMVLHLVSPGLWQSRDASKDLSERAAVHQREYGHQLRIFEEDFGTLEENLDFDAGLGYRDHHIR